MSKAQSDAKAIFLEALDCKGADELMRFLEQACGTDAALRTRVEELLRAHQDAGAFLGGAEKQDVTRDQTIAESPGTVIGPYKLIEQIGEGGMGLVFVAEQQCPVRRKVALKVIKPGMDSRQVVARFEAERQALALMDHPNIAQVHDGGQTGSGRPYFVMELVKGMPITDYCDANCLTPRARLELFLPVCQAVQHAHQKGVIHRDIKPSNVLVASHDGVPVVKIIDFGVAKAVGQPLTERTVYTQFAQWIGTPLYMSPEQAGQSGLDVDTRSDIYSLGVLLYELLTGTTPFDKERFKEATFDEIRRIIREEEPSRPSTRISTLGLAATMVSTQRQSDPRRLSRLIRGELDWIVMKALEKDRNRRYATANGLARDIERYLHDEPVQACPPSAGYRLRKLVRRNKAALAVAACLAFLVAVTAIGASVAAITLHGEQKATRHQLDLTRQAEEERTSQLFRSLVAQARANRLSRRLGQRFESLRGLQKATQLARRLNLPEEDFRTLRNEAIAALALPDLRVAREWPEAADVRVDFDAMFQRYACVDREGNVQVRRADDGEEIYHLSGVGPGDNCPTLSRDGTYLSVFESSRARLHVWKLAGAEPPRVLDEPTFVRAFFSPDSRQLALQDPDGSISLFDLATGTRVRQLPKVPRVNHFAWHPSGRQLALACNNFVQVHDLETGKVLGPKNLAAVRHRWAEWHPDGKTLAVEDRDGISLWDVAQDQQIGKLEGIEGAGLNFTFNPAGTVLANTGWAGILEPLGPAYRQTAFPHPDPDAEFGSPI